MGFSDQQVRTFVKRIIKQHGGGKWGCYVEHVQRAIVAREVLGIIAGQDSETVKVKDITDLWARIDAHFFGGES